ncbi:MAG: DUF3084 domain-containing protein [Synergistaceae bacterium]|jgi:uncharacterized protein (DUF3084 family)|nr:DUF3084 domain-containing protein [Synergistaceae bacterium]
MRIWTSTNWSLIILIIAGGAVIATLGDVLGFMYGKRRVSILGLRPRYTSRIITAFTGMFISLAVLTVLSFFSQNVRTALFSMKAIEAELEASRFDLETLRNERDLLSREKDDLGAEVSSLQGESEELRRELDVMRQGAILVQANSILAQRFVPPMTPASGVREVLDALALDANEAVEDKRSEKFYLSDAGARVAFDPAEDAEVIARTANLESRAYIRALAAENAAAGEEVKARLESGMSYLLYSEGDILYRKLVDPTAGTPLRPFNAENVLHVFLRELKNEAIKNGVRPDPATNSVGSLGGEDFFDAVENLKAMDSPVILNAVATEDIYTEGPVRIRIVFD